MAQVLFILILVLFFQVYFKVEAESSTPDRVWLDMGIGIFSILLLNLFAYFILGIRSVSGENYTWELATRISFLPSRIEFPLAFNTREFSQTASLLVILSMYFYRSKLLSLDPLKRLSIVSLFIGIAILTIVLADARMTLMMTLIALCVFLALRKFKFRRSLTLGFAALFLSGPFWYFLIVLYVNQNTAIDIMESDFWTLNNRLYVWASTIPEILNRSPSELLIGSGYYSQAVTGLSDNYAMIFVNWIETAKISYHNAVLQMIFDTGLIGTGVYFLFLFSLLINLLKLTTPQTTTHNKDAILLGLTLLIFFLGIGITEAITPLYYDSFLIMIIILKSYLDYSHRSRTTFPAH